MTHKETKLSNLQNWIITILGAVNITVLWYVVNGTAEIAAKYGELSSHYDWLFALLWVGTAVIIRNFVYAAARTWRLYRG